MKNKRINLLIESIIGIIMLSSIISAQEIATWEDINLAGITPDKPVRYALETAFNRITEIFSDNLKVKHAQERLAEVKVMLAENKIEASQKALEKYNKIYSRVKDKTKIAEDKKLIDNLGQRISTIASQKGSLNETQRSEIKILIEEHKNQTLTNSRSMQGTQNIPQNIQTQSNRKY